MTSVSPIAQNDGKWPSPSGHGTNTQSSKASRGLFRIIDFVRAFRDSFAPLGYEDENGFHYGERPERSG